MYKMICLMLRNGISMLPRRARWDVWGWEFPCSLARQNLKNEILAAILSCWANYATIPRFHSLLVSRALTLQCLFYLFNHFIMANLGRPSYTTLLVFICQLTCWVFDTFCATPKAWARVIPGWIRSNTIKYMRLLLESHLEILVFLLALLLS